MNRVSQKNFPTCFCQKFIKSAPNLIILGIQITIWVRSSSSVADWHFSELILLIWFGFSSFHHFCCYSTSSETSGDSFGSFVSSISDLYRLFEPCLLFVSVGVARCLSGKPAPLIWLLYCVRLFLTQILFQNG